MFLMMSIIKVQNNELPEHWNTFPHHTNTQKFSDLFVSKKKYSILQVPSAVTKGDYNFLFNPYHTEFENIKIISVEKFPFDRRIFG